MGMLPERRELSWVPRRVGDKYCSPACGHGCTWADYERAVAAATELAESVSQETGAEWDPKVRENGGWSASADLNGGCTGGGTGLSLSVSSDGYYHVSGLSVYVAGTSSRSLAEVIASVRERATEERDRAQALLDLLWR